MSTEDIVTALARQIREVAERAIRKSGHPVAAVVVVQHENGTFVVASFPTQPRDEAALVLGEISLKLARGQIDEVESYGGPPRMSPIRAPKGRA